MILCRLQNMWLGIIIVILILLVNYAESISIPRLMAPAKMPFHSLENFEGKTIIVTGCSTGIGKEMVRMLYELGATVILACRNEIKTKEVIEEIISNPQKHTVQKYNNKLEYIHLDLSDFPSIITFVQSYSSKYNKLDVLINNAGLNDEGKTKDGLNQLFQVNYLGHYLLTRLLLTQSQLFAHIKSTPNSVISKRNTNIHNNGDNNNDHNIYPYPRAFRIINLSSVRHHTGDSRFMDSAYDFRPISNSYDDSKYYMNLLTYELNKRYSNILHYMDDLYIKHTSRATSTINTKNIKQINQYGDNNINDKPVDILSIAVNPGAVQSDIWRHWTGLKRVILNTVYWAFLNTIQGAETSVYASCVSDLDIYNNMNKYCNLKHYWSGYYKKAQSNLNTQPITSTNADTSPSYDNHIYNDKMKPFIGHPYIPYIVPYHIPTPLLIFEKIGPYAGPTWGKSSITSNMDKISSTLWNYSEKLCNEILTTYNINIKL